MNGYCGKEASDALTVSSGLTLPACNGNRRDRSMCSLQDHDEAPHVTIRSPNYAPLRVSFRTTFGSTRRVKWPESKFLAAYSHSSLVKQNSELVSKGSGLQADEVMVISTVRHWELACSGD